MRYSACVAVYDVTSCTDISRIIEPHISGNLAEKHPPPQDEENILTPDLSISGNFEPSPPPPPPQMRENFLTPDLSISGNFEQLWFLWQKSPPPPPRMRGNFLTLDLSILGNFEQLWFLWQKSPPPPTPRMRENF